MKLSTKFAISLAILFVNIGIIMLLSLNFISNQHVEHLLGEKAMSIATSVADSIDAEQFTDVLENNDINHPYFLELSATMYRTIENLDLVYLYSFVDYSDTQIQIAISGSEEPSDLLTLDEKAYYDDALNSILIDNEIGYSKMDYTDIYGYLISGYAPIKNDMGETVGYVGCDVNGSELKDFSRHFIISALLIILITSILSIIVYMIIINKIIIRPIKSLEEVIIEEASYNFATKESYQIAKYVNRKDEIGNATMAIKNMENSIRELLNEYKEVCHNLFERVDLIKKDIISNTNNSSIISDSVEDIANGASSQASDVENGVMAAQTMSTSIDNNINSINSLRDSANDILKLKNEGLNKIEELVANSNENNLAAIEAGKTISSTSDSAKKIASISNSIKNISNQTNLLALNAAIESARAGEAGKGFSVVADEIRQLAESSNKLTEDIAKLVEHLLTDIEVTNTTMANASSIVNTQAVIVKDTEQLFNGISLALETIGDKLENIIAESDEMVSQKNVILDIMSNLSAITEENSAATQEASSNITIQTQSLEHMVQSANELEELAKHLEERSSVFRT